MLNAHAVVCWSHASYAKRLCWSHASYAQRSCCRMLESCLLTTCLTSAPTQMKDGVVQLEWPDHHESVYPIEWLDTHRFSEDRTEALLNLFEAPETLWTAADMQDKIQKFIYEDVCIVFEKI